MPIYDGCYDATEPIGTTAPPIQLFHPVFGHFLDDLSNDLCVPPEIVKATVRYMRASSAIYDNEAIRRAALEPRLGRILSSGVGTVVNPDGTWPDGAFSIPLTNEICGSAVTLIKEDRNNFGDGGSDPSIQVGLSMARFWAQDQVNRSDFYLLLSALPSFSISTQVCAITPVVQLSCSQLLALGSPSSAASLRTNGSSSASQILFGLA